MIEWWYLLSLHLLMSGLKVLNLQLKPFFRITFASTFSTRSKPLLILSSNYQHNSTDIICFCLQGFHFPLMTTCIHFLTVFILASLVRVICINCRKDQPTALEWGPYIKKVFLTGQFVILCCESCCVRLNFLRFRLKVFQ